MIFSYSSGVTSPLASLSFRIVRGLSFIGGGGGAGWVFAWDVLWCLYAMTITRTVTAKIKSPIMNMGAWLPPKKLQP